MKKSSRRPARRTPKSLEPGRWTQGALPPNVRAGPDTIITGDLAFKRFHSRQEKALVIGAHCTMDGVHFALGEIGRVVIGNYCYFTNAVLLCEVELRVGDYVVIGWNATIADTDFHPIAPAERIADAIACSPLGKGLPLGAGAFVEAGALVTRDVPARARVMGNPARVIGKAR